MTEEKTDSDLVVAKSTSAIDNDTSSDQAAPFARSFVKNDGEIHWLKVWPFLFLLTLLFVVSFLQFSEHTDSSAMLSKAKKQFEERKYDEALRTTDSGITLFPYEPNFHFYKSQVLNQKGFKRRALDEIMLARASNDYSIIAYRAQLLADCGDFQAALADYDRLSRNKDWAKTPEVIAGRNRVEVKTGSFSKALEAIDKAISLEPKNAELYTTRARIQTKLLRYHEAQADWTKVITLTPENATAYAERALVEYKSGEIAKANTDLSSSLNIAPNGTAYCNRGLMRLDQKQDQAAAADFLKALKLEPSNLIAIKSLGRAYGQSGDYEKSLFDFDQALKSIGAKDSPNYYQGRASLQNAAGHYKQALSDLQKASLEVSDRESLRLELAQCYEHLGELTQAYREYSELLDNNPRQYDWYLKRGSIAAKQHHFSLAIGDFEAAISLMPNNGFEGYLLEGQALAAAKMYSLAIVSFRHALKLNPNSDFVRMKLVECSRLKESERLNSIRPDKDALAYESKLRSVAAADVARLKEISYEALQRGDFDLAVLALTRAIKLKPNDPLVRQYMTSALMAEGQYSQAIDQFLAWDQISKFDLFEKLLFAKRISDRDAASKLYGKLIEQYSTDPRSLFSIALECNARSWYGLTKAAIDEGLKNSDDSVRTPLLMLQAKLKAEERKEYQKFSPEDLAKLNSYVQPIHK